MANKFFREANILELTNRCNNYCVICQDNPVQGEVMKSFPELKNEVNYFVSRGTKMISIYGGEPYLNKNIDKILEYIGQFNIACNISTNARIFSYEPIVKNLRKLKRVSVITTLFSRKKDIHEYITDTPSSYNQTIRGIKNLIKVGIPLVVTITITKKNVNDLLATVRFLKQLGVKVIKISGLINQGRVVNRHDLLPAFTVVKDEISKAVDFSQGKDIELIFEKLPICVASAMAGKFKYEAQHKQTMLICPPNLDQCPKCDVKFNCMCF